MQAPVFENTGFRKQTHSNPNISRHYSIIRLESLA